MSEFDRMMGEMVLFSFLHLSDDKNNNDGLPTEMAGWVKEKIQNFVASPFSDAELYDFMDDISRIPAKRMGFICVGDISSFMQVVCDVTKYYTRPVDGEKKLLDMERCKKMEEDHDRNSRIL